MYRLALAGLLLLRLTSPSSAEAEATYRPPEPPRAGVIIYRGTAVTRPAPVAIYRGSSAPPARGSSQPTTTMDTQVAAGSRLWLLDREQERLVACSVRGTGIVGRRAIRCVRSRLPNP
jgi:hypothetical protein